MSEQYSFFSQASNSLTSLVEQLQADAMDRTVPITDLLRKAKVAAVKLKRADLSQWIEWELSGYPPSADLPQYRRFQAELKYWDKYHG